MASVTGHPDIYQYHPEHLDSRLRDLSDTAWQEMRPGLFRVHLFDPGFCAAVVRAAELSEDWVTEREVDPRASDHTDDPTHRSCLSFATMPDLQRTYLEIVRRHIFPLMRRLFSGPLPPEVVTPYVLRYTPSEMTEMAVHSDDVPYSLVVYLNDEFEGGGTHFPELGLALGRELPGTAILYPGGPDFMHGARTVTSGRRYVLICDFR